MKKLMQYWMLGVCLMVLTGVALAAETPLPFVRGMQTATSDWRGQLTDLQDAADGVATRLIAGGHLYVADTQKSFQIEGLGRSGGLMLVKVLNDKTQLTSQDTIVAGVDSTTDPAELDTVLKQAKAAGVKVLLFAGPSRGKISSGNGMQVFPSRAFSNLNYVASPGVETVSNTIGLWSWMAELVTSCVRRGHVPTMFVSDAMPGGRERNMQFRKIPFHITTDVTPASVRGLTTKYLDDLSSALAAMDQSQSSSFVRGGKMLHDATASGHHVYVAYMGHMFPYELQWPGNPGWEIDPKVKIDNLVPAGLGTGDVFFFIDYQYFPWDLTAALQAKGIGSIVTCSMKPLDHWATDKDIDYINPFWEVQDAAVDLPGYDTKILPTSGILQSTVYWQLVELSK